MSAFEEAMTRLSSGYYNANPKTLANPGGFGGYGHTTNLFALEQDIYTVAAWLRPAAEAILSVADNAGAAVTAAEDALNSFNATKAKAEFFTSLTVAEVRAFLDEAKFFSALALIQSSASEPVAWASVLTPDLNGGWNRHCVLGGNTVLNLPANRKPGHSGRFRFHQPAGGGLTLSYQSGYRFPLGLKDISSGPNAISCVSYYVHSAADVEAVVTRGYAA